MSQQSLSKRILDRTISAKNLFYIFCKEFNITGASISSSLLEKSMHYYFNSTQLIKNNHRAVDRTNDSKKFAFIVKAINITKPIRFSNTATYRETYINELFSIYCGINHIEDKDIRDVVLSNTENFVYLIFNQEMNYLQLALTMDLLFKKEGS